MEKTFRDKIYELLKKVPKGKVTTYKDLANALETKAYRAVGTAMNKNESSYCNKKGSFISFKKEKEKLLIPCHRVVNANGDLGGFAQGNSVKIKLLKKEGIEVKNNKIVDFKHKNFNFFS